MGQPGDEYGRGLAIVAALADKLGHDTYVDGQAMWAGANAIFRKIRFESSPLGPDRRAIQAATANILLAFAAGPAGRRHPARELIPPTGRPPLLGTS